MPLASDQRNSRPELYIGRQPIYDRALEVMGYELLFRSFPSRKANILDGDDTTRNLIVDAFADIDLRQLTGDRPTFINITGNFIRSRDPLPFTHGSVALEIFEDVVVDPQLLQAARALSQQGFKIVLDDFVYGGPALPLLELADIVKIDTQQHDKQRIRNLISLLQSSGCRLLAENIETHEGFTYLKDLGFDYFQGCFLSRPRIVSNRPLSPNRLGVLQLLTEIQAPDCDFEQLVEIISHDPSLSYKLLQHMNSALYSFAGIIESVQQAAVMLGMQQLRQWGTLLALSGLDDKPRELMNLAVSRAKMCEQLATFWQRRDNEVFFTVGLFSVLDSLMDAPLGTLLQPLPLSAEVRAALLHHDGAPGAALALAIAYERGRWDDVSQHNIEPDAVRDAYLASLCWAAQFNAPCRT